MVKIVKGGNGEKLVFESTILYLSILDTWIMNVLKCMMSQDTCGVYRQKIYVDKFQSFLTIYMWKLCEEMNKLVKVWEPQNTS